ncbi:MAG TPA: hypothetical protein VMI54_01185, partial [Polyangiaceae bacterium]|nr:hypothetical protein [Polyangiaceae bacterium]
DRPESPRETPHAKPETLTRRNALGHVVLLPLVAALGACSKTLRCEDTSSLTPDDAKLRSEIAAYTDVSQDPNKHCSGCMQFNPGGQDACGTCKVVKGPINPNGSCKLWVKKT